MGSRRCMYKTSSKTRTAAVSMRYWLPGLTRGGTTAIRLVNLPIPYSIPAVNGYVLINKADVCHAYQIFHQHGVPDENIVVMMYDDIADNEEYVIAVHNHNRLDQYL